MTLTDLQKIRETGMKPNCPIYISMTGPMQGASNPVVTEYSGNLVVFVGLDVEIYFNRKTSNYELKKLTERLVDCKVFSLWVIDPENKRLFSVVCENIYHKRNKSHWYDIMMLDLPF